MTGHSQSPKMKYEDLDLLGKEFVDSYLICKESNLKFVENIKLLA